MCTILINLIAWHFSGLEMTASLEDELSSAAKSALKRIKEMQDGGTLEEALTKA